MIDFEYKNGRWIAPKNPADDIHYRIDFSSYLEGTTTIITVLSTTAIGVTVTEDAVIQNGTEVVVKLSGLDVLEGALNFCRFRLVCANGDDFEAAMWFEELKV